jgi:hypothetical protein
MGNDSGEQVVGRRYLYDLYRVELATGHVERLWDITWKGNSVVPVREMVVPDDESFYTLCYSEHLSDSFLLLYRFSLGDGSCEALGDSIPIRSDKIATNANCYYDMELSALLAVVQEFDDDIASTLKIYSLAFPPISHKELAGDTTWSRHGAVIIAIIIILCAAVVWIMFVRRRRAAAGIALRSMVGASVEAARPNSICLFGDFTARDRRGVDISHLFSARIRQAFCLILQHSDGDGDGDGLASRRMGDMLWPGRKKENVKNSVGVAINHLRKVLGEFDGIRLISDKGHFRIIQSEPFYCDLTRAMRIIDSERQETGRMELLGILRRGKFLKFSDHGMFDSFKEETERRLEPMLSQQMKDCFAKGEYRTATGFAEVMFRIDPLSSEALSVMTRSLHKLNMREEANLRQQTFAAEYLKTMGRNYPVE